ncbi:beta-glucosidase family protein [Microbacterium oleivorans]|uniref:Beta-glucosidase n=1 Tax=Microbacterium oleivorans TaxID=273677 RepID=A0A4R5YIU9_9MICO|nr:glycoside hydrolase family 3 N-terminal domain-containing protein [Microbacterium oleivorans]TDL45264.1 beta-glucosidase [Microbacterium oleivorans]
MNDDYLPYRDATQPVGVRVRDLLDRMTLEEKAAQIASPFGTAVDAHNPPVSGWGTATAAIAALNLPPREAAARVNELQRKHIEDTRLGIPVLLAEEALLGFKVQGATTFPDAIAQAATWDPQLIEEMASEIGTQMTVLGARMALSPLADVARDPRWGRVGETYGEDPYLVGATASAFVRGLQTSVPGSPVIAALKHFVAYGASDGGRNTEPAPVGDRQLREFYGLPFHMAIRDGGADGIMPSYNDLDGVPVTGSSKLLDGLLREEYGFDGLVISDLDAIGQLHTKHGTSDSFVAAFADAIRAGVDIDLDNRVSTDRVVKAVESGLLTEAELDRAVAAILRAKFRLGLFERPYVDVESVPETLDSPAARSLARKVAERSIVLLKNDSGNGAPLLPLSDEVGTIAVIGPNAHRPMGQLGHYAYQVLDSMTKRFALAANPQARVEDVEELRGKTGADDAMLLVDTVPLVTFLDGIRDRLGDNATVLYEPGCPVERADRSGIPAAVEAARRADVAVVVVGDQAGINGFGTVGEGLDSATCELPGVQRELVEAILGTGTPTVVVLSHARPYVLRWLADRAPAIMSAWLGGEEAGAAAAAVLFGDVNPAGRLPIAMLENVGAAPVPYWRSLQTADSYVDGSAGALFPFGHGLSYTQFAYTELRLQSPEANTDGVIRCTFTVTNTGDREGDEVVQIYGRDLVGRTVRRTRVLLGFQRLELAAGEERQVLVEIPAEMFALWDPEDGWVVEPGAVRLFVGGSSASTPLRGRIELVGPVHHSGRNRALWSTVTLDGEMPEESPDEAQTATRAKTAALTTESTIGDWLEHPNGRTLLLEALGGVDEDALAQAVGLTLDQLVMYSQGVLSAELAAELLNRANAA